jgi:hypothetical protein
MSPELSYLVVGITSILFLIIIDLIAAVALAIKNKTFDWSRLLDFLRCNIAPYVLIWGALGSIPIILQYVELSNDVIMPLQGGVGVVWLLIVGRLIQSIWDNFKELGIEIRSNNES